MSYLLQLQEVKWLNNSADHFDAKTIEGQVSLRQFIAGMLSYYPAWIKALYSIRWLFVRFLGMKQGNFSKTPHLYPEDIPFEAGKWATFFQVEAAQEENFWIASASDKHLSAYIIVAAETLPNQQKRFHVGTIVHYKNWAGPVYFNVIRPFHHLVVSSMMKAGLTSARA
jgi:hypothetical protein